jgi:hypothetical protein
MAAELPRPGVEVVQEFASTSPTIVTPTLVPCNVGPFFEVIEALVSDGTLNEDAKLEDLYDQLEVTVSQSSFPSPRNNIDEVNVLEETIRCFFEFGGDLIEVSDESAYLTRFVDPDPTSRPYVVGTTAEPVGPPAGYDVDGRTLILSLDGHTSLSTSQFVAGSNLPTSNNVTVNFSAAVAGGRLTLQEVIDQINALLPGVAMTELEATTLLGVTPAGAADQLALVSTKYGAGASVVVRPQGTAIAGTDRLGFDPTYATIAVGSGFYAADDSDGDQVTPRLKIYKGCTQVLQNVFDPDTNPQTSQTAPFLDANIEAGDTLIADGVSIGDVTQVESDQLTMEVEQRIMSHDNKFAPRRVWVQANNLVYPPPASSFQAEMTGTVQCSAATPAYLATQNPGVLVPIGAAESFDVNVIEDGVALATQTVSSGAGWADLAACVSGINGTPDIDFEAYYANEFGEEVSAAYYTANTGTTYLGLRTKATNTGSGAGLTVVSSTVTTELGFTTLPLGDVGENVRYRKGTPAVMTSTAPVTGFAGTETIAYEVDRGGVPLAPSETFTLAVAGDLDLAVAEWNDKARHTEAYKSTNTGAESSTGTYLSVRTRGENVGLTAAEISLTTDGGTIFGTGDYNGTDTDLDSTNFQWSLDNSPKVWDVTFIADEDDDGVSLQQVLDKINEMTPGIAAASPDSPPFLVLTSGKYGEASEVETLTGTANLGLGMTDDDQEVGGGRPSPDMAIDISGNLVLQSQLLYDGLTGEPYSPGFAPVIVAYKGLRLDLSPEADNPALLVIDDIDTLEAAADPISTDNPGALMTFLSLINAPSVSIAAIGVPEVSADAPNGTPLGYAKCAEFLESEEVYAISTASQISTVHQTFMTHVNVMSEPEQKGERIYFFNPQIPDRAVPDIVGSGTDANSTATANEVLVEVNIAPALIAAGLDPNSDLNPDTGEIENHIYLDLGGDDKYYLIQRVDAGTQLTLRTDFVAGDGNDDAFFSADDLPTGIISDDWSVFIRGEQLLIPGTTKPDRNAIAETIQAASQAYGFRRAFYVHPDQVGINVTGLEQVVEGYYAASCVVGMCGELPPQQGFTNYPITGLTRVVGGNDMFTNSQLNVMAAGGVYILVQDAQGAPVICRHQLSTDLTSIETRELSITKVVDYTAKFLRTGLRNFIGRSNITQPFLDNLSTVIQGQLNFLTESGVLIGADINNIIQDADQPDTVLVDVTLDVPFPCNYIRLTLVI